MSWYMSCGVNLVMVVSAKSILFLIKLPLPYTLRTIASKNENHIQNENISKKENFPIKLSQTVMMLLSLRVKKYTNTKVKRNETTFNILINSEKCKNISLKIWKCFS